jgi:hypothetical protein
MTTARTVPSRLLAVLVATAMALLVLPVTAALAAPTGSVTRTSPLDLFPGASRTFSFTVSNTGAAVVGESVNWVRFVLPSEEAGVEHNADPITPPAGWTATRDGLDDKGASIPDSTQSVTFRASSPTAAIRPGSSLGFSFPARVDRPLSTDETGTFTVAASSDNGRTTKGLTGPGTALDVNVRILQVVPGTLGALAPQGVVDQSGTAGQPGVVYGYDVRNYARNNVTISGVLASNGDDQTGGPVTVTVPGVGGNTFGDNVEKTAPVRHTITLGSAPTANRTATFSAVATAPQAASGTVARPFTIEVPAALTLTNLQPKRVRTATGSGAVTFTADAAKTGSPGLTVNGGTLTITSGTTVVPVRLAKTPVTFGGGNANGAVEFEPVALSETGLGALVNREALATATATVSSVDANGFDAIRNRQVLNETLTLDNLAPALTVAVTLPLDADGRRQTAARDTNRIEVSGTITGLDAAPTTANVGPRQLKVTINDGTRDVNVPVTVSGNGPDYTFSGSAAPSYTAGATSATVKATVTDTAGNIGTSPVATYVIDNVVPKLESPGRTTTVRSIVVQFSDDNTDLLGGCDPQHYLLNNVPGMVERVEFAGGNPTGGTGVQCTEATAAPGNSGVRVLILRNAMAEDATPQVTYSATARTFGADPVKDGAANEVVRTTIDTIRQIAPLAPEIVRVTRNQGAERATEVDAEGRPTTYYTRFSKVTVNGTQVDDLEVRFLGSRNNYQVQVLELDAAGNFVKVLNTRTVTGPATPLDANEQGIRVPLNGVDGTYRRALRFVTTSGSGANQVTVLGELARFDVVLDRVVPGVAARAASGNEVTVTFNEVIQSGGDFASDWFGLATTSSGSTRAYQAETVTTPSNTTRKLTVPFPNGSSFAGIEYRFTSGPDGGLPVVDRAGNRLLNQRK